MVWRLEIAARTCLFFCFRSGLSGGQVMGTRSESLYSSRGWEGWLRVSWVICMDASNGMGRRVVFSEMYQKACLAGSSLDYDCSCSPEERDSVGSPAAKVGACAKMRPCTTLAPRNSWCQLEHRRRERPRSFRQHNDTLHAHQLLF